MVELFYLQWFLILKTISDQVMHENVFFFKIESISKDPHLERTRLITIKDKRNKLRDLYHALRFIDQKFTQISKFYVKNIAVRGYIR